MRREDIKKVLQQSVRPLEYTDPVPTTTDRDSLRRELHRRYAARQEELLDPYEAWMMRDGHLHSPDCNKNNCPTKRKPRKPRHAVEHPVEAVQPRYPAIGYPHMNRRDRIVYFFSRWRVVNFLNHVIWASIALCVAVMFGVMFWLATR